MLYVFLVFTSLMLLEKRRDQMWGKTRSSGKSTKRTRRFCSRRRFRRGTVKSILSCCGAAVGVIKCVCVKLNLCIIFYHTYSMIRRRRKKLLFCFLSLSLLTLTLTTHNNNNEKFQHSTIQNPLCRKYRSHALAQTL